MDLMSVLHLCSDFDQMYHSSSSSMTMQYSGIHRAIPQQGEDPGANNYFTILIKISHLKYQYCSKVKKKLIVNCNPIFVHFEGCIEFCIGSGYPILPEIDNTRDWSQVRLVVLFSVKV